MSTIIEAPTNSDIPIQEDNLCLPELRKYQKSENFLLSQQTAIISIREAPSNFEEPQFSMTSDTPRPEEDMLFRRIDSWLKQQGAAYKLHRS